GDEGKPSTQNQTSTSSPLSTETVLSTTLSSTLISSSTNIPTKSPASTLSTKPVINTTVIPTVTTTVNICKSNEFLCSDGTCIEKVHVCDGKLHCPLGEDEYENCECSRSQFRCNSGQCVDASSRCDGNPLCFDKSDEMNCSNCTGFQCASGQCLWTDSVKCNFHVDCMDLSDEMNCTMPNGYRPCNNGLSVHWSKICDGVDDCFDNTDENNCSMCNILAEKPCDDRKMCVMAKWFCDGHMDCSDGSDERNCGVCGSDEAQCSDYSCISAQQVCDGIKQCPSGDDEVDCLKLTDRGITGSSDIVTIKSHDQFLPVCSHGWTSSVADDICRYFGYRDSLRSREIDQINAGVSLSNGFMVLKDNHISLSLNQSLLAKFDKKSSCPGNKVIGVECRQNVCGERKIEIMSPFIVGGTLAPAGKWPWVVSITRLGEGWCGGVIVNQQWILTAAHCIVTSTANYSLTPHFFEVTAGTNTRQRHGDVHSQSRQVDEVILHPKMIQFKTGLTEWDLALLHLKLPLLYTDYVQPICFPDENDVFPTNSQCYLAGWGFINTQEVSVDYLREGKMRLWSDADCAANGISTPLNTNSTVCAGYRSGAISACKGDSGSPLMCSDDRGRWRAIGVMSHGVNGCDGRSVKRANRYAKVSTSINWIHTSVGG
ncbi:atrial natriuretic peptide-converting enzyme-like, partial [Ruditapes philippinarum]|uniref:atrial natriuretic peptide-converting enzyme-like n=1 Tax=Ruditapes philippinarum TaxID=129788 RepID=UPI00295B2B55